MAEAILRSFGNEIEIYSAGIEPSDHVSPIAIEVMAEVGIRLEPHVPQHFSFYEDMEFDYLITVGDGTVEQIKIPPIKHKRKLHLGFHNPYKNCKNKEETRQKCREIRDEIMTELDYFYNRILKKQIEKMA
jgi:arsenate reductase (thioredoxin)